MADLGLTPSQTAGPYLSIGLLGTSVAPELVEPGTPGALRIHGQLLDGNGDSVPDGMIEIWQATPEGRYPSPAEARAGTPAAAGFRGFGRSGTADGGRFEFVTVKPGRVPAPDGGLQAPHLLVGVFARGLLKRVATRLYFPDEEPANAEDFVLSRLAPAERETLVALADGDGVLRFDIRLQGDRQTTFFAL
jgi:protocatechuate 3,4-dioxygenase alpha subunit